MIVCPSSHSCVLGTNFFPIRTPGNIMSFGVSPVIYSDSELYLLYVLFIFYISLLSVSVLDDGRTNSGTLNAGVRIY